MVRFGYTLFSELNPPAPLVEQAQAAESTGFEFAVISDHFHPWVSQHSDSPFAWSVLGAVAQATHSMQLGTLVTCPFVRYHPAVIAQAAATMQSLSDGRFTLAVGSGERLNEHVVGHGWPPVDVRHEMLTESIEIIQLLWSGGFHSYRGRHLTLEDARLYTLPDTAPDILVAGSGAQSIDLAARVGDGFVATDPEKNLVDGYREQAAKHGGAGRSMGQVALCYDRDPGRARELAMRFAFGTLGWKVMAELPSPANFDAAIASVRTEDVTQAVGTGPEPEPHLHAIRGFVEAGFDDIAVVQVGDDHEGFFRFWESELAPRLTKGAAG